MSGTDSYLLRVLIDQNPIRSIDLLDNPDVIWDDDGYPSKNYSSYLLVCCDSFRTDHIRLNNPHILHQLSKDIDLHSIRSLEINSNYLSSLDLSPLSHSSNLFHLEVSYTQLESLLLPSSLPSLRSLRITSNNISEIDLSPLRFSPFLDRLELTSSNLVFVDFSPLENHSFLTCILFWSGNPSLKVIMLKKLNSHLRNFWVSDFLHSCGLCNDFISFPDDYLRISPCDHTFHRLELLDSLKSSKTCPSCDSPVSHLESLFNNKVSF